MLPLLWRNAETNNDRVGLCYPPGKDQKVRQTKAQERVTRYAVQFVFPMLTRTVDVDLKRDFACSHLTVTVVAILQDTATTRRPAEYVCPTHLSFIHFH